MPGEHHGRALSRRDCGITEHALCGRNEIAVEQTGGSSEGFPGDHRGLRTGRAAAPPQVFQYGRQPQGMAASLAERSSEHPGRIICPRHHVSGELLQAVLSLAGQANADRLGIAVLVRSHRKIGHGSPTITLSVYAHLFEKSDEAAAQAIDAVLSPAPKNSGS